MKRSPDQYGYVLGYCLEVICPHCKRKQSFTPRRKEGELYPKINPLSTKTCVVCGKKFLVKPNILKERDVRIK